MLINTVGKVTGLERLETPGICSNKLRLYTCIFRKIRHCFSTTHKHSFLYQEMCGESLSASDSMHYNIPSIDWEGVRRYFQCSLSHA